MKLWQLTPMKGQRSENWKRSSYDGSDGPVIVRAPDEDSARGRAACAFEQQAESRNTLFSPWMMDTDTEISECTNSSFPTAGSEQILHPVLKC
ncbi:MAG: hypothetical protein AAB403_03575 [Planctomycetota bacterium]